MAARSLPEMAEVSSKMKLPSFVSCFLHGPREPQPTNCCPRVPGVLLVYVLLQWCTAVCRKGLVGGWVEGALRRPWCVGGPFRAWESFFVLWEINFFLFLKYRSPTRASTVPTAVALLCPLLPYVLLHCRTAALLLFCFFVLKYRERYSYGACPVTTDLIMRANVRTTKTTTFTTVRTAAPPYCSVIILLFWYLVYIQRMVQHQLVLSAIPAGNRHTSGVPLVS